MRFIHTLSSGFPVVFAVLGTAMFSSCSLSTFEQATCSTDLQCSVFGNNSRCLPTGFCSGSVTNGCTTSQECVASNGFGSICDTDTSQCRDLTASDILDRCDKTEPTDLFDNLDSYRDRIVFVTAHNTGGSDGHKGREAGVLAGIKEINGATVFQDQAGVGRQFGLVMCDELAHDPDNPDDFADMLGRSDAAVESARFGLEVLGLPGIIGPAGSSDTIRGFNEVVKPINEASSVPLVAQMANGAASPAVTTVDAIVNPNPTDDDPGWLWRSSSSGEAQGVVLARDASIRTQIGTPSVTITRNVNERRAAIIHEAGAFGSGIADAFQTEFGRLSANNLIVERVNYTDGSLQQIQDQSDVVRDQLAGIDVVLFAGQVGDHTNFMEHISQPGSPWLSRDDLVIYFPQTAIGPNVFAKIPTASGSDGLTDQIISANPATGAARLGTPPTNPYEIFRSAFVATDFMGRDPDGVSQAAQSWDAAWLMAGGAMWAAINTGEVNGENISRGIRRMTPVTLPANEGEAKANDGILDVQFDQASWALIAGTFGTGPDARVDVDGATGTLSYDLGTEEKPTEILLIQSVDLTSSFQEVGFCDQTPTCSYSTAP